MCRSLMTIIRELYLYRTKVIFMLKHSVKLRCYINWVIWQYVCNGKECYNVNLKLLIKLINSEFVSE